MKGNLRLIGGKKIESPTGQETRPTTLKVRAAVFNILNRKVENSNWLDLFSGSGSIACEAYNHGAKKIVALEKSKINFNICARNLQSLSKSENRENDIQVICQDVLNWTKSNSVDRENKNISKNINFGFDFVYLDPPYAYKHYEEVLENIYISNLVKKNTIVICEHSRRKCIKENKLWRINDIRCYGQTKLSFLINI